MFLAYETLAKLVSVSLLAALSKFSSCCFGRKHFRLKRVELLNRIALYRFGMHLFLSAHVLRCVLMVAWHIFIRVDAANEAVHELVAEPVREPRAEEQQEVAVEHAPVDFVNPADLQGKPRSITII